MRCSFRERAIILGCATPAITTPRRVRLGWHQRTTSTLAARSSITSTLPPIRRAAELDQLCAERDVVILQTAGTRHALGSKRDPGIADPLQRERRYPGYLNEKNSRISNPAQSVHVDRRLRGLQACRGRKLANPGGS